MAKPTDKRPWAFEDSPQWKAFRGACERAGLTLRSAAAWGDENSRVRGDSVVKCLVHGERGVFITTIIVEGFGPEGFALYPISEEIKLLGDVNALVERGKALAANQPE